MNKELADRISKIKHFATGDCSMSAKDRLAVIARLCECIEAESGFASESGFESGFASESGFESGFASESGFESGFESESKSEADKALHALIDAAKVAQPFLDVCCEDLVLATARGYAWCNGKGSWAANPWVWVIEFKKVDA